MPNYITAQNLNNGIGEGVCFVLNETINYELMRRDFRFNKPKITNISTDDEYINIDDLSLDNVDIMLNINCINNEI